MQYNHTFCGTGFPNCGQYYPCLATVPTPSFHCNTPFPEVIGEGDVTTFLLPDGSTQLYFLPASKWCAPQSFNPNFVHNINPFCDRNYGIWFIRSVSNPIPPSLCHQPNQIKCGSYPNPRQCYSCSSNVAIPCPCPEYNMKFHNDCWTSTTDIHYFFPNLRTWNATPKQNAGVQVAVPTDKSTVCVYDVVCNKPCHCAPNSCGDIIEAKNCNCSKSSECKKAVTSSDRKRGEKYHICECYPESCSKIKNNQSYMSVDVKRKSKRTSKNKTKKSKKKDFVTCECSDTSGTENKTGSSCMSVDDSDAKRQDAKKRTSKDKKKKKNLVYCECGDTSETENRVGSSCMSIDNTDAKQQNTKYNKKVKKTAKKNKKKQDNNKHVASSESETTSGYSCQSCASSNEKNEKLPMSKKHTDQCDMTRKVNTAEDQTQNNSRKHGEKAKSTREDNTTGDQAQENYNEKGNKIKKKKRKYICECDLPAPVTSNKTADTDHEQASGNAAQNESRSQKIVSEAPVNHLDAKTELWYPKTPASQKAMMHQKYLGVCMCDSETNSICSCYSNYADEKL